MIDGWRGVRALRAYVHVRSCACVCVRVRVCVCVRVRACVRACRLTGSSHGTGPIPTPKEQTNITTLKIAQPAVHSRPGCVSAKERQPIDTAMPMVDPSSSGLRPARSISQPERIVMRTFPTFMRTAMRVTVSAPMPFALRKVDEKLKALLMPENC